MRKVLYGLAGLIVLIVAAAFIAPALIDFNAYKADIQARARDATGRDLVIDGNIKLAILPSPQLSAEGVHFANIAGSATKDMAQLKSLRVSVALLPLISGKIEVTQVTLVGPTVVLETLADGHSNWELGGNKPEGGVAGAATGDTKPGSGISVKDLAIEDGTLIWRDARAGKAVRLDAVNGRLSADTLDGPFSGRLAFKAGEVPVDLEARTGALSDPNAALFAVVKTTGGEIRFDGHVANAKTDPKLDGALKGSGDSLAALVQSLTALSGAQPAALPPALAQKFTLDANVVGSRQQVALAAMKLVLGDDSGSGDATVQMGPPLRADLKLNFAKLDFDKLLVGAKPAAPPPAAPSAPNAPPPAAPPAATPVAGLPANIEGSLDLSVGTIVYQGKTAQNVAIKGDLSKGTLTIATIGGQFPGDTVIAASGSINAGSGNGAAAKGQPAGSGKVDIRSGHLRDFLAWLNIDISQVPADRLNAFAFAGQIAATPAGDVQIANAVMQLDGTTAKGAVTIRSAPKLAVVADLDIDTLNVDAYLNPSPAKAKPNGAEVKPNGADKKPPATGSGGVPIDAVVKARVAHLIVQGNQIDGVDVDVTVAPDKLTFRPSKVASAAGATAKWSGTVAGYASATPDVDLTVDLQTQDADRLVQMAGMAPPLKGQRIGPLSASGRIASAGDALTFNNFAVAVLGSTAKLSGSVKGFAASNPVVDLTLDLQTPDADRMLQLAGVASPLKGQRIGAFSASGRVAGRPDDLTFNNFAVVALGASLKLTGKFSQAAAGPSYNFSQLEMKADDGDRLMALFGVNPSLAGGQRLGAVSVSGAAQGNLDQATVDLDVNAFSATFDLKGAISGLRSAPNFAIDVGLNHPDFARLVRIFSPSFGGGQGVGAVKLQMRVDGSPSRELKISNLRGSLGATSISGTISANMATPVPSVVANLDTGELDLGKLLALGQKAELSPPWRHHHHNVLPARFGDSEIAQSSKNAPAKAPAPSKAPGPTPTAKSGGRFPTQALDVSTLRSVDAKIDLKSQALIMAPWRVDNAVATIDMQGGVVNITRITGRAFDGDLSLNGALNASRLPATLNLKLSVVRLDMDALSRAINHKNRFDGRVSVNLNLTGSGSSQAELVNNLNGAGDVGGTIQFNAKVQEQLAAAVLGKAAKTVDKYIGKLTGQKNYDSGGDIDAAISVALQRFANRENPISGNIAVRNGVASTTNLRIVGNKAHADTNFVASLPAWTLDATTNVFLDEKPTQIYLIVTNKGPLDDPNLKIDRNDKYSSQTAPQTAPQQTPQDQQQNVQPDNSQDNPQPKKPKKFSPLDLFKKK